MKTKKSNYAIVLTTFVLVFSGFGTFYSYFLFGWTNIHYFTNQSNLLVFLVVLAALKYDNQSVLTIFKRIALLDILITGLIYNTLLIQYQSMFTPTEQMVMWITHTVVPATYTLYYYTLVLDQPRLKNFYIMLIHPLIYFIVFSMIGAITGYYVYPFMDASTLGWPSMLGFTLGILMPLVILLSLGLIYLKQKTNVVTFKKKNRL